MARCGVPLAGPQDRLRPPLSRTCLNIAVRYCTRSLQCFGKIRNHESWANLQDSLRLFRTFRDDHVSMGSRPAEYPGKDNLVSPTVLMDLARELGGPGAGPGSPPGRMT